MSESIDDKIKRAKKLLSDAGLDDVCHVIVKKGSNYDQYTCPLDPNADPECKQCHGMGRVNVGNVCSGFGGKIETIECMCIVYKKIGMKM